MARIDIRINVSFKNTDQEMELYNFVKEKGEIIGISSYIKQLIQREIIREQQEAKK